MNSVTILVIVNIPGYKFLAAAKGSTIGEAIKIANQDWDEEVKVTFVKVMENNGNNFEHSNIAVLCELERDGRFIARQAAQILRSEIAMMHRLNAA